MGFTKVVSSILKYMIFMASLPTPAPRCTTPRSSRPYYLGRLKTHWFPLIRPAIKTLVSEGVRLGGLTSHNYNYNGSEYIKDRS